MRTTCGTIASGNLPQSSAGDIGQANAASVRFSHSLVPEFHCPCGAVPALRIAGIVALLRGWVRAKGGLV
jgi:hypothetical protein